MSRNINTNQKKYKNSEKMFRVEKILDKKIINGQPHYLVKWKKYPKKWATWEPLSNYTLHSSIIEFEELQAKKIANMQEQIKVTSKKSKQQGLPSESEIPEKNRQLLQSNSKQFEPIPRPITFQLKPIQPQMPYQSPTKNLIMASPQVYPTKDNQTKPFENIQKKPININDKVIVIDNDDSQSKSYDNSRETNKHSFNNIVFRNLEKTVSDPGTHKKSRFVDQSRLKKRKMFTDDKPTENHADNQSSIIQIYEQYKSIQDYPHSLKKRALNNITFERNQQAMQAADKFSPSLMQIELIQEVDDENGGIVIRSPPFKPQVQKLQQQSSSQLQILQQGISQQQNLIEKEAMQKEKMILRQNLQQHQQLMKKMEKQPSEVKIRQHQQELPIKQTTQQKKVEISNINHLPFQIFRGEIKEKQSKDQDNDQHQKFEKEKQIKKSQKTKTRNTKSRRKHHLQHSSRILHQNSTQKLITAQNNKANNNAILNHHLQQNQKQNQMIIQPQQHNNQRDTKPYQNGFKILEIVNARIIKHKCQYLVRWKTRKGIYADDCYLSSQECCKLDQIKIVQFFQRAFKQ